MTPDDPEPLFMPGLFAKVLAGTTLLALAGLTAAVWLAGSVSTTDIVGTTVCVPIVAYLVHLWLPVRRS